MQAATAPVTGTLALRLHHKALIGLEWLIFKTGAGATNHFEVAGYVRTRPELRQPNIQICFIPLLVHADGSRTGYPHGYQASVMVLRPRSRGRLTLAGPDPNLPPRLSFHYLSEPEDIAELREGVRTLRRIFAQPALTPFRGEEVAPGSGVRSDADLDVFIRATAKSTHHPCGTCRMGIDANSVVDGEGRVHGIHGLRVIDASIMPRITSGNINAPVLMIAEKIADCVRGLRPLEPVEPASAHTAERLTALSRAGAGVPRSAGVSSVGAEK